MPDSGSETVDLLVRLAQSLKMAASRDEELQKTRHMLMEKARDAFLLRAVPAPKRPLDLKTLQAAIHEQILRYGGELLSEAQFDPLIQFAEEYLKAGDTILGAPQKKELHRLLAILTSSKAINLKPKPTAQKAAIRKKS